ncbi:hypothetical protein AB0F30_02720 [Streptomyces sp. NPDC029006]|uniref:hypothetical protein n=1 Tax=Streptomyces sp. NPDC029006 TaxID=3155467 RepID=UPI0033EBA21B
MKIQLSGPCDDRVIEADIGGGAGALRADASDGDAGLPAQRLTDVLDNEAQHPRRLFVVAQAVDPVALMQLIEAFLAEAGRRRDGGESGGGSSCGLPLRLLRM